MMSNLFILMGIACMGMYLWSHLLPEQREDIQARYKKAKDSINKPTE